VTPARAQNSLQAFSGKQSLSLSLMRKVEGKLQALSSEMRQNRQCFDQAKNCRLTAKNPKGASAAPPP
jgi:hypothetical protein